MHKYAYMARDRNFSYFCDNWRKRKYPPPCARDAETHIRRTHAAAAERQTGDAAKKFRQLASTVLAVFTNNFWPVETLFNRFR